MIVTSIIIIYLIITYAWIHKTLDQDLSVLIVNLVLKEPREGCNSVNPDLLDANECKCRMKHSLNPIYMIRAGKLIYRYEKIYGSLYKD